LDSDVLGYAHERRQLTFDGLKSGVGLAFGLQPPAPNVEIEPADGRQLRKIEKLGNLGPDLASLRIDARLAAEHEIEAVATEGERDRSRRCQSVRSGKDGVHEMHSTIGAEREAMNERLPCLWRPHRKRHDVSAGVCP